MPGPGPDQRDQRAQRNRRPRRRAPIGGGGRAPVTEYDELQELEAARERNDLDVNDLREMSVTELRARSRAISSSTPRPANARTTCRPDPPAPDRARGPSTTRPASSTSSTRASASCAATACCPARMTSTSARARSAASACASAIASRAPFARRARPEKYWGLLRVDSVNGVDTETARARPRLRRPDPGPPGRPDQPRDRPEEPQPAADQPRQPDRQGPARPDRQPAEGRQDDAAQADRQRRSPPTTRRSS